MNLAVWLQLLLCKTVRPVWQNAQWTPRSKNVTWEKGGHPHYPSFSTFEAEYGMWKYTYFLPILNYQKIQSQSPREYWFINNDPGVNPHIGMYKKQINTYIHLRCINPIYIYIHPIRFHHVPFPPNAVSLDSCLAVDLVRSSCSTSWKASDDLMGTDWLLWLTVYLCLYIFLYVYVAKKIPNVYIYMSYLYNMDQDKDINIDIGVCVSVYDYSACYLNIEGN